ncbi:uncharacterized protein LOC143032631 [Oratosquilla oratoria]|uniref:uncharacterized protein LOC143032631 n=1 Tax=Oratosquilla oratoria TaxID=337810 RepID=UPI003F758DC3
MLCLALAALLSVAAGHPVDNCVIKPAVLYSGQVLPVPLVYLSGTGSGGSLHVTSTSQPAQNTAAVAQATAEFMASWNAAADRARQIQATLVPSGHTSFSVPKQVQETEAVRRATAEFMAAWNAAAERASAVEIGVTYGAPKPVQPTAAVQRATAEFMTAWRAAAQRAATVHAALSSPTTYSTGVPRQVEPTEEVRRATEEFMMAWRNAAARVPKIQTTMYQVSGIHASGAGAAQHGSLPQPVKFTPEVERATSEFMAAFNKAAALAAAAPDHDISRLPPVTYSARVASQTYTGPLASGIIVDSGYTKEVDKARREFQRAFDAAATGAAAASDTEVSHLSSVAVVTAAGSSDTHHETSGQEYSEPDALDAINVSGYTKAMEEDQPESQKADDTMTSLVASAPDSDAEGEEDEDSSNEEEEEGSESADTSQSFESGQLSEDTISSGFTKGVNEARDDPEKAIKSVAAIAFSSSTAEGTSAPTQVITYDRPQSSRVDTTTGYTEEVDEARREFQKAYDAVAALADSTPDHDTKDYTDGSLNIALTVHPSGSATYSAGHHAQQILLGPVASGVITASGFTQEVEAARREFLDALNKAAARAPTPSAGTSHYGASHYSVSSPSAVGHRVAAGPRYSGPLASGTITPSGYTVEVEEARRQFMRAYDAAAALAAKTPDYSAVTYTASAHAGAAGARVPQPVQPTPEVARATAEFMAAWNAAAARVATIESTLVRSSPASHASISLPTREEALAALRKANEEFMAAWNAAARRASTVQHAVTTYRAPQPVQPTAEVQRATAEFMAAWQAAARRVPKIEQSIVKASSYSTGVPQQVQATADVQKATAEFMAAWNAAAARVPKIETYMYSAAQPAAGGSQQFLNLFKSAEHTAVKPSGSVGFVPFGVDVGFANNVGTSIAYAGTTASSPATVSTLKTFPLSHRLFAPVQGQPLFYDCNCN